MPQQPVAINPATNPLMGARDFFKSSGAVYTALLSVIWDIIIALLHGLAKMTTQGLLHHARSLTTEDEINAYKNERRAWHEVEEEHRAVHYDGIRTQTSHACHMHRA